MTISPLLSEVEEHLPGIGIDGVDVRECILFSEILPHGMALIAVNATFALLQVDRV